MRAAYGRLKFAHIIAATVWSSYASPIFSAFGQDQIERISPPAQILPEQIRYPVGSASTRSALQVIQLLGDPEEYHAAAKALINATLGAEVPGTLFRGLTPTRITTKDLDDPNFSCIIHVLKWKNNEIAIDQQAWFTYQGGRWTASDSIGSRIFGQRRVAILAIHLNAPGMTPNRLDLARVTDLGATANAASVAANGIATAAEAYVGALAKSLPNDPKVKDAVGTLALITNAAKQAATAANEAAKLSMRANSDYADVEKRQLIGTHLENIRKHVDNASAGASQALSQARLIDSSSLDKLAGGLTVDASTALARAIDSASSQDFLTGTEAVADFDRRLRANTIQSTVGGNFVFREEQDKGLALIAPLLEELAYRVDVSKKLPAPVSNLLSLANLAPQGGDLRKEAPEPITVWGGRLMDIRYVPSDMVVRLTRSQATGNTAELSQQKYDNEGRYFWDVSIGLPVHQLKQVEYSVDSTTNQPTVNARTIDRQKIIGILDLYFPPVNTKSTKFRSIPHPVIGLALSSRPLDRTLVGGAMGLNRFEILAGVAFNRVRVPQTLHAGDIASDAKLQADLKDHMDAKFVIGLNLPLRQVLDAVKKK